MYLISILYLRNFKSIHNSNIKKGLALTKISYSKLHIQAICNLPEVKERWRLKHGSPPTSDDAERIYSKSLEATLDLLPANSKMITGFVYSENSTLSAQCLIFLFLVPALLHKECSCGEKNLKLFYIIYM